MRQQCRIKLVPQVGATNKRTPCPFPICTAIANTDQPDEQNDLRTQDPDARTPGKSHGLVLLSTTSTKRWVSGTGKTLALLCATLAWRHHAKDGTVIYYGTRTHSQIKQVVSELNSSPYRPRMAILGARERLCCNSAVRDSQGSLREQCKAALKDKRCGYFPGLATEQFAASVHKQCSPGDGGSGVFDIEDLVDLGKSHQGCPYFTRFVANSNYATDVRWRVG